jgi:hypothetical protein
MNEMLLAYLMTRDGLEWYQTLRDEAIGSCRLTQTLVNELPRLVRCWFVELTACDWGIFEETWAWYLQNAIFGDQGNSAFWTGFRRKMVKPTGRAKPVLCEALGTLAMILVIVPVSESGVEPVFCTSEGPIAPTS